MRALLTWLLVIGVEDSNARGRVLNLGFENHDSALIYPDFLFLVSHNELEVAIVL